MRGGDVSAVLNFRKLSWVLSTFAQAEGGVTAPNHLKVIPWRFLWGGGSGKEGRSKRNVTVEEVATFTSEAGVCSGHPPRGTEMRVLGGGSRMLGGGWEKNDRPLVCAEEIKKTSCGYSLVFCH